MSRPSAGTPTPRWRGRSSGSASCRSAPRTRPGRRLSELPLVERLGSRARRCGLVLPRLEQEGLIEALATGGYVVRQFTRADVDDAIELRGALEGTAARFAAERRPPRRRLDGLRAVNDEIGAIVHEAAPSFDGFVRYVVAQRALPRDSRRARRQRGGHPRARGRRRAAVRLGQRRARRDPGAAARVA